MTARPRLGPPVLLLWAVLIGLLGGWSAPARAAPPAAVPVETITTMRDLTDAVDWCQSDTEASVGQVAAGACAFQTAKPGDMSRGFSSQAFWLRVTLVNRSQAEIERWLRIGYPALGHVRLYEETPTGFLMHGTAGLAVNSAARPLNVPDPVFPLRLAPGDQKVFWIRVTSETSLDLTPSLWVPNHYLSEVQNRMVIVALAIGGMLITAGFTVLMFLYDRTALYLFFIGTWLCKAVFTGAYAVLIPDWVPVPMHKLMVFSAAMMVLCNALFTCAFVGEAERYRRHRFLLIASAVVTLALAGMTCWVDYRAVVVFRIVALVCAFASLVLFWRSWRSGFSPAGFTFWASMAPFCVQVLLAVSAFGVTVFNDTVPVIDTWARLLTAPLALYGIAIRREHLVRALAEAQAENATRLDFLTRISHELRTPLDTILETAQLLSRPGGRSQLDADLAEIQDSGWRLLRMIDDILDYARGLAGRLTLVADDVEWPAFLADLSHTGQRLADKNGTVFRIETTGEPISRLHLDPVRLRQVIDNLLRNAARHTHGGVITLTCDAKRDGSGRLVLSVTVADTGEGIASDDLDRIFRPFERGHSAYQNDGRGIGVGLAVARQLVERMGGHLSVESVLGQGASFHFDIQAESAESATPACDSHDGADVSGYAGRRRTVLLVDDQERNRAILARFLRDLGFTIVEAEGGREAAALCASMDAAPDLVLTDQMMPDGDGWSLLAALGETCPDIPVVLFSAKPPERPKGVPAGRQFTATLMKPLDHARLVRVLGGILDLDWYNEVSVNDASDRPPVPILRPPEADLAMLRALVATGQISAITDWADMLTLRETTFDAFANAVATAAQTLDFKTLDALAGSD